MEQIKKVGYIVQTIPREELYRAFKHGEESRTEHVKYVGTRGAESKQEKSHHTLAYCANGEVRRLFAGLKGMSLYNRKIWHRNNIAALDPKERAKILHSMELHTSPIIFAYQEISYWVEMQDFWTAQNSPTWETDWR